MNKFGATLLAGLLVLGLGACNAEASQGNSQTDPPPVTNSESPVFLHRPDCARPHPVHVACAR